MRTTLDIDDDVLAAAKERARREGTSVGKVVSRLLRQAMTQGATAPTSGVGEGRPHYGFQPFSSRGVVVSDDLVEQLRSDEGL
ncbi:MAG: hypothetical protein JJT88_18410 [Gammaproteobacteria bacterium]|nr:hypothetical protein [Gammaproteobacteria bacterium]